MFQGVLGAGASPLVEGEPGLSTVVGDLSQRTYREGNDTVQHFILESNTSRLNLEPNQPNPDRLLSRPTKIEMYHDLHSSPLSGSS